MVTWKYKCISNWTDFKRSYARYLENTGHKCTVWNTDTETEPDREVLCLGGQTVRSALLSDAMPRSVAIFLFMSTFPQYSKYRPLDFKIIAELYLLVLKYRISGRKDRVSLSQFVICNEAVLAISIAVNYCNRLQEVQSPSNCRVITANQHQSMLFSHALLWCNKLSIFFTVLYDLYSYNC